MPITCSGRPVAAASDVIGIELVFDARIASRRQHGVGAAEDVLLRGRVLDDRLDHQVGRDELVGRRDAGKRLVRVGAALLRELHEARAHRRRGPVDRAGNGSCSDTRRPDAATTCAMPLPICPAPTTRTCSTPSAPEPTLRTCTSGPHPPTTRERSSAIRVRGWQAGYRHVFPAADLDALDRLVALDAARSQRRRRAGRPSSARTTGGRRLRLHRPEPRRGRVGELYAIYVDPEDGRRGAGRALIAAAEERLADEYAGRRCGCSRTTRAPAASTRRPGGSRTARARRSSGSASAARGPVPQGLRVIVRSVVEADLESVVARVHWLSSNTAYGRSEDFERRLRQTREAFQLDYVRPASRRSRTA